MFATDLWKMVLRLVSNISHGSTWAGSRAAKMTASKPRRDRHGNVLTVSLGSVAPVRNRLATIRVGSVTSEDREAVFRLRFFPASDFSEFRSRRLAQRRCLSSLEQCVLRIALLAFTVAAGRNYFLGWLFCSLTSNEEVHNDDENVGCCRAAIGDGAFVRSSRRSNG
jgi:hypothetical protein